MLLLHAVSEGVDAWAAGESEEGATGYGARDWRLMAETKRIPGSDRPRERVLHLIGNSHIDPVWLWQWPEGYQEVRATFRSALDRMTEYPEFIFTCDSAAYYEWVEEIDPEMFAEIKARVDEGRWELVGGWWVEPDCNLPGGESFVRHALIGQRYFESRFGKMATVGYNVDPFGHHAMLPQILAKSGMDSYVFMRPGPHENAPSGTDLLVGVAGRLTRAHASVCRMSTAHHARTSAITSTSRSPSCPTAGPR